MKHTIQKISLGILSVLICVTAGAANPTPIIPAPVKAEARDGVFNLQSDSRILADAGLKNTAKLLAERLRPATGYGLRIKSGETKVVAGDILLTTNGADASLG